MFSHNEEELIQWGQRLGKLLRAGDVLVLTGDLGAGKTTFTKGLALGLGISQMIKSPTYTIVREYEGRLPLYHLDVYRIGDDPDSIDLDDFLFGEGVTVIEWGELLGENLPEDFLKPKEHEPRSCLRDCRMTEYELCLREAEKTDAAELIVFLNQVGSESDYMTLDEAGILMNQEEMASFIEHQTASSNQLYLLALLNGEIAGLVSITADFHERIRHIGQVFVVVKKAFWNQGLGRILLEEALTWAEDSQVIRRLELSVQVRNERAVHLYKDLGFEIEGLQKRGAYLKEGIFLDVYLMGKLID